MIFIDYTLVIDVEHKIGTYVGAGNFVREIIYLFKEKEIDFKIIVYKDFTPEKKEENELLNKEKLLIRIDDILHVNYDFCDVLFLPVANGYLLKKIRIIRKKYNELKIYAVIHDKQHNLSIFDPVDRFFYEGIASILPIFFLKFLIKMFVFNLLYPSWIKSIDKVFTVSNYSVQALSHKNIKRITYFYQQASIADAPTQIDKYNNLNDFILFVSGGRAEKNLVRALLAFYKYINQTGADIILCITGIKENIFRRIIRKLDINQEFVNRNIRTYDYLQTEELAFLFKKCRYVMFVSKAEGFGLPVLESMKHGKTVLASWQTSIPEVAGSILYYVNAYDVDSIYEGIKYLSYDYNLKYREYLVKRKLEILKQQIELDNEVLIYEIGQLK